MSNGGSFLLAELRALEAAYAAGVDYVRYEDRQVRYPSGEDLLARILLIRRELGIGADNAPRSSFGTFSRGG